MHERMADTPSGISLLTPNEFGVKLSQDNIKTARKHDLTRFVTILAKFDLCAFRKLQNRLDVNFNMLDKQASVGYGDLSFVRKKADVWLRRLPAHG